jgi:hypothetical protein
MTEKKGNSTGRKEEFKLAGSELIQKIKDLIHEGNIRRIILKTEEGKTIIEIPLTLGLVGVVLVPPVWAALGAIAALMAKLTLVVEKEEGEKEDKKKEEKKDKK